jgi:histidinol-phosphatase (PHP family)
MAIESYFIQTRDMISTPHIDIVGHIDKISMNTAQYLNAPKYPAWYKETLYETLLCAKNHNVIVELNLRGLIKGKWYTSFIDEQFLPWCKELNIPMTVSTDAHHPSEVAQRYDFGIKLLKANNIHHIQKFNGSHWEDFKI